MVANASKLLLAAALAMLLLLALLRSLGKLNWERRLEEPSWRPQLAAGSAGPEFRLAQGAKRTRLFVDDKHQEGLIQQQQQQQQAFKVEASSSQESSRSLSGRTSQQEVGKLQQEEASSSSSRPPARRPTNRVRARHKQRPKVQASKQELAKQQQKQQVAQLDIVLERDNFVLHNRCSRNRLSVQLDRRAGRARVASKQQRTSLGARNSPANDAARIKLLSMVITLESASRGAPSRAGSGSGQAAAATSGRRNEVKLRANLTELYICFDAQGNLEAKVSRLGSFPLCSRL